MSLTDDLALVTACRDALGDLYRPNKATAQMVSAALSLIEDTLNRHQRVRTDFDLHNDRCALDLTLSECHGYEAARAALHTIATALGVEVPTKEGES